MKTARGKDVDAAAKRGSQVRKKEIKEGGRYGMRDLGRPVSAP